MSELDDKEYGTTAVVAVVVRSVLVIGNVGDSRAVLYRRGKDGLNIVLRTQDHRPSLESERKRVEASGGEVIQRGATLRIYPRDLDRAIIVEKQLGLAMSRALGHLILGQYGISAEPEIFSARLQDGDTLVIACDGVWDKLTTEEVRKIIAQHNNPRTAARAIVRKAENSWKNDGMSADNMTTVVVVFNVAGDKPNFVYPQ